MKMSGNERSPIIIIVSSNKTSHGRFEARLASRDEPLVASSRQPLLDAARALLEKGYDPTAILEMKHEGSDIVALRAQLGKAAKLTVEEGPHGPRFVALRKGSKTRVVVPPIAPSGESATTPPEIGPPTSAPVTRQNDEVG